MIFFRRLNVVEFFVEVEKYYGEYEADLRVPLFNFIKELNDWQRAALYNELIEHYSRGFNPPDVYRFNLYLKRSKRQALQLEREDVKEKKEEEKEDFEKSLMQAAAEYGLNTDGKNLLKKMLACEIQKRRGV